MLQSCNSLVTLATVAVQRDPASVTAEAGLSGRPPPFPLSKRWPPVFCLLSSRSLLRRRKTHPDSPRGYELMLQHDSEAEIKTLSRFSQPHASALRRRRFSPLARQKLKPSHLERSADDKVRHAPRQRRGYLDSVYLSALAPLLIFWVLAATEVRVCVGGNSSLPSRVAINKAIWA